MKLNSLQKLYFGLLLIILISSHFVLMNFNLFNSNYSRVNQNNVLKVREAANSIIFNEMYYYWSGSITIIGIGGFGWSGTEIYYYESGNIFRIVSTNSYFGDEERTVDNSTRLLSGSSIWSGHDP
ncbi:MAG: hypothetical protein ACTSYB_08715, partial [Candidatus Helarchaeota archaeon]